MDSEELRALKEAFDIINLRKEAHSSGTPDWVWQLLQHAAKYVEGQMLHYFGRAASGTCGEI